MESLKIPDFKEDEFYMALPESSKTWIVVQYKGGLFVKTNNTNRYAINAFDQIHPKPIFESIASIKAKANSMQKVAKGYYETLKEISDKQRNLTDNDNIVTELLKSIGTVVDQINGDMVLTGNDLEATNAKIVKLYTMLKDRDAL